MSPGRCAPGLSLRCATPQGVRGWLKLDSWARRSPSPSTGASRWVRGDNVIRPFGRASRREVTRMRGVSTCRVVVAELERSRRSPNEAKIEINSDLREPGLAQSGKPRRAKRRRVAFLGGKTERASLAPSALVAQARGERVAHRPEQRRPWSGKLGALHGAAGGIGLGRGGIALTRKRVRGVNRRGDGTSEAGHDDLVCGWEDNAHARVSRIAEALRAS